MNPPDPDELKWANDFLDRTHRESRDVTKAAWSALRERVMTVAAATIGLSLLVFQISDPHTLWAIQTTWILLLLCLTMGLAAYVLDYHLANRVEQFADLLDKVRRQVGEGRDIDGAEQQLTKLSRPVNLLRMSVDWSLYAAVGEYLLALFLLVLFAWSNLTPT